MRIPLTAVMAEARRPASAASALAVGGGLSLLALARLGSRPQAWALVPLFMALAWIVVFDVRKKVIPDIITMPALVYSLGLSVVFHTPPLVHAVVGVMLAGGALLAVVIVSRGAIGGGDVKLMALLGAVIGWKAAWLALALSQVGALGVVVVLSAKRRRLVRGPVPVGALIALVGAVILAQTR